ncbi:MAG TPA: metallophosphoesterase [Candidatus Acidoferrales bacterium]|nr:metallophosphoesterase [Candidatus Acidoferrales bacterium]
MQLTPDMELVEGMPIAYVKSLKALVFSDLHLGYEGQMAKKGVFVPKVNLKKIIEHIAQAATGRDVERLIIVGDIKNDFSKVDTEEFNELYELISFAKQGKFALVLIKGNHDNFVDRYKEPFKLEIHTQSVQMGEYFFFHGEETPRIPDEGVTTLIMGHEHPAISITNKAGRRDKLKCFLYGKYKKKDLLVLPAMNFFAGGTEMNVHSPSLLSPVLTGPTVRAMRGIAIGYGSTEDFGKISELVGL